MKKFNIKRVTALCLAAVMLSSHGKVGAAGKDTGNALELTQMTPLEQDEVRPAFGNLENPVLLRYIAKEYNCTVNIEKMSASVTILDKDYKIIHKLEQVAFVGEEPVIEAVVLENELGWSFCKHVPETDMFDTEYDAMLAGWLTFYKDSMSEPVEYVVGRCYYGFYFSKEEGGHAANCGLQPAKGIHQEDVYRIDRGYLSADTGELDLQLSDLRNLDGTGLDQNDSFSTEINPVMLKYIVRKNNAAMVYNALDDQVTVFDSNGTVLVRFKEMPFVLNELTTDKAMISRELGWENVAHQPDTDMFDTEADALLAAYLTLYRQSEGSELTFYTGSCYEGHYFSLQPGGHASVCTHDKILSHMHADAPVMIENGVIHLNNEDYFQNRLTGYAGYGKTKAEKPEVAMMKMVTVFHTEYANPNGVQSTYFTNRDKVYRNYWEDIADYDVTDYIFIAPSYATPEDPGALTSSQKESFYRQQNETYAADMAGAIANLLAFKANAHIWIGTPGITSMNFAADGITGRTYTDYIGKMKRLLGETIWHNNIIGLYMNQESLYGTQDQQDEQVERFVTAVSYFKTEDSEKEALWIPYYDLSQDKIAKVSQIPDLFDYIIIQPGYFFFNDDPEVTERRKENIEAVRESARNNVVSDATGQALVDATSNAYLGLEMETQISYFSTSRDTRPESIDRYTLYLMAGAQVKLDSPIAYYTAGDPYLNKECLVFKFYESDKDLGYQAIRKRLDENLRSFFDYVFATREKENVFKAYAKALYLDAGHTEEAFDALTNIDKLMMRFYRYEKSYSITDLSEYIEEGGTLKPYFDNEILELMVNA